MLGAAAAPFVQAAASKPNIIYITADQQKSGDLACLGNPVVHTPNLDRLAREGVAFNHAFCQFPVCLPSRVSMLTGRYPHSHRVRSNSTKLPNDETPLPAVLREAGYFAGATGVLESELAKHFDEYVPTLRPKDFPGTEHIQRLRLSCVYGGPDEDHWDMRCMRETVSMLRRHRDRPQFLYVCFQQPHLIVAPLGRFAAKYPPADMPLPASAAKGLRGRTKFFAEDSKEREWTTLTRSELQTFIARRWASTEMLDSFVGEIRAAVDDLGLGPNTVWVYQSDHGDYAGEFGIVEKVPTSLADALIRVPLILSAPGRMRPRGLLNALVQEIDVMPTLLELAGLPCPKSVQGLSLLPLVEGRTAALRDRVFAQTGQSSTSWMVRTNDWKYIFAQSLEHELYDLRADPGETNNLAGSHPDLERKMQEQLLSWIAESSVDG
jgi:arylsulfatase A-like enzyme